MSESLFSQSWYRVQDLHPRLRSHVEIHRHTYRGLDWYVLQDHSTGRFHRFTPEAYQIIGMMDGKRRLDEIWTMACSRLGDDMPSQDEVIALVSQLYRIDVIQTNAPPNIEDLQERNQRQQRNLLLANLKSPLAMRIPLLDPDWMLDIALPVVRPWFSWIGGLLWLLFVLPAAGLAVIHWTELTENLVDQVLTVENLMLLWIIYPVVKILHELGHAYAVKSWGGEVHEMGVMLLVFVPVPYVDASASSGFREKSRRMGVGAAGIVVELFLAASAMYVWLNVVPGPAHAIAYNVMVIAGASTILFNGNPLLRFDSYYILADYLEIPNMGTRGNRQIAYLAQRFLLGIEDLDSPASTTGEAIWLTTYATLAFCYRLVVTFAIVTFVATKFFVIGTLLAAYSIYGLVVQPAWKILTFLRKNSRVRGHRARVLALVLAFGILPIWVVFRVPVALVTVAEGVVAPPEQSQVHAAAPGFITEVTVPSGAAVRKGDTLIRCENNELSSRMTVLQYQLVEFEQRHRISLRNNVTEASILEDEIERVKAELARANERREALVIRAPLDGIFLCDAWQNLEGKFVQRGEPLGHVVDFQRVTIRMVLRQGEVERVAHGTRRIEARMAETFELPLTCRILRLMPAASTELPSLALSVEGGGSIALDPRQGRGPRAFEPLFHVELEMGGILVDRLGGRVYVRFEHEPEVVWDRLYREGRRLLLKRFEV